MMYVQTAENGGRDSRDSVQYDYDGVINKRHFSAAVANLFAKTDPFRFNRLAGAVKNKRPRRLHPTRPDQHALEVRNG